MLNFLEKVFNSDITIESYKYPGNTPKYIRSEYKAQRLRWNEKECILITPNSTWNLPLLKESLMELQNNQNLPYALCLKYSSPLIRKDLVDNNIPFMYPDYQVYFPFWDTFYQVYPVAITEKEELCLFKSKRKKIIEFLNKVLEGKIIIEDCNYHEEASTLFQNNYIAQILRWNNQKCILLTPVFDWDPDIIKNDIVALQKISNVPCMMCFEELTTPERYDLIQERIPFIIPGVQVYITFWKKYYFEHFWK